MPFIVVDAIDGAGKHTAVKSITDVLAQRGLHVFDLIAFMREQNRLPDSDDQVLRDAQVILSSEPTYTGIGRVIRDELITSHPDHHYSARAAAEAFALDRLVLFTRVLIPFLRSHPNRWIVQERGLISSLAYQPLSDPHLTIDWLLSLEGNALELAHAPDLLILLHLSATEAMKRLAGRTEKQDGHIFEEIDFQSRLIARYADASVRKPFLDAGTRIVELNAERSRKEIQDDLIQLIK